MKKEIRSVRQTVLFGKGIIHGSTDDEKSTSSTEAYKRFITILRYVMKGKERQLRCEEELSRPKRQLRKIKMMLIKSFEDHRNSGLYTSKINLLYCMVEDTWRLAKLSLLHGRLHQHIDMHMKQRFEIILQRKRRQVLKKR